MFALKSNPWQPPGRARCAGCVFTRPGQHQEPAACLMEGDGAETRCQAAPVTAHNAPAATAPTWASQAVDEYISNGKQRGKAASMLSSASDELFADRRYFGVACGGFPLKMSYSGVQGRPSRGVTSVLEHSWASGECRLAVLCPDSSCPASTTEKWQSRVLRLPCAVSLLLEYCLETLGCPSGRQAALPGVLLLRKVTVIESDLCGTCQGCFCTEGFVILREKSQQ